MNSQDKEVSYQEHDGTRFNDSLYDEEGNLNYEKISELRAFNYQQYEKHNRLSFENFPESIKNNILKRLLTMVLSLLFVIILTILFNLHLVLVLFLLVFVFLQLVPIWTRYVYTNRNEYVKIEGIITNVQEKGFGSSKSVDVQISDNTNFFVFTYPGALANNPIRIGLPVTLYVPTTANIKQDTFGNHIEHYLSVDFSVIE